MKKAFVHGYFLKNLGDDLFLKVLLERYPNTKFRILGDDSYKVIFNNYKNLEIINRQSFNYRGLSYVCRKINNIDLQYKLLSYGCDCNIYIGGSLFIESNDLNEQIAYYKALVSNKKISFLLGSNFGPYKSEKFFNFFKEYITIFEDVCFREKYSYNIFKSLDNVRLAPDIVFNLPISNNIPSQTNKKQITISVKNFSNKEWYKLYIENLVNIINYFLEQQYRVTLVSFCEAEGDQETVNEIFSKVNKEYQENLSRLYYKDDIEEILVNFQESDYVIATRFHAMILGLLYNKVTLPLIYNSKMINVLEDINFKGLLMNVDEMNNIDINEIESYFKSNYKLDLNKVMVEKEFCFKGLDLYLKEN